MSEAELHLIRARLDGGLRNKAKRGELEHVAAGRAGPRRGRRGSCCRGRTGPARDRAGGQPVAAAGSGTASREELVAEGQGCRGGRSVSAGCGGPARAMGRCTTS